MRGNDTSSGKVWSSGFNRYAFERAIWESNLPFNAKVMAVMLANYANKDTGIANPGYETIRSLTKDGHQGARWGKSRVAGAVNDLVAAGILWVETGGKVGKDREGGRSTNTYRLRHPTAWGGLSPTTGPNPFGPATGLKVVPPQDLS